MPAQSGSTWKWRDSELRRGLAGPLHIDVWLAFLPANPTSIAPLSPEERRRAERFRFPRDRHAYIFHHSALRRLLGAYLGMDPASVPIETTPHGKPCLAAPHAHWNFNMAHSGEAGIYAICQGRQVGVDIERVRPIPEAGRIAVRFFTPAERASLNGAPESFFEVWTRKEAMIKAGGAGPWSVLDLPPVPGYAAALAVEGAPPLLDTWRYPTPP